MELLLILIGLLFYFLPWFVAMNRGHVNVVPIFMLNFFLGWSLVGWVIALVWAFTAQDKPKSTPPSEPEIY